MMNRAEYKGQGNYVLTAAKCHLTYVIYFLKITFHKRA